MLDFNNKILSVDIGSKTIKMVNGTQKGKKVVVDRAVTIDTPEGAFSDGYLTNIVELKQAILPALKEMDHKARHVVFSSKGTSIITRIIEVPLARDKEMESLIEFEIKQYLPLNFEDYIVRFKKLNEFDDGKLKKCRVSFAVYPKDMAKAYWDLAKELKLIPIALDLSSNCVSKLFNNDNIKVNFENYSINDTVAVIDMGYDQMELNIISNGVLEFTRIIQGGGSFIDGNIASQLAIDTTSAEEKKSKICNLRQGKVLADEEKQTINDAVKLVINRWYGEFNRIFDYFKNKNRDAQISRIYTYGGTSDIKGLDEYMRNLFEVPTERLETMSNIITIDLAYDIGIERYLNAIGAIMRLK